MNYTIKDPHRRWTEEALHIFELDINEDDNIDLYGLALENGIKESGFIPSDKCYSDDNKDWSTYEHKKDKNLTVEINIYTRNVYVRLKNKNKVRMSKPINFSSLDKLFEVIRSMYEL